jgi:hypothetical protein
VPAGAKASLQHGRRGLDLLDEDLGVPPAQNELRVKLKSLQVSFGAAKKQ